MSKYAHRKTINWKCRYMRCSHCERCCQNTEMELSKSDIEKLVKKGYRQEDFTLNCDDGLLRLRNVDNRCYFYDVSKKRCHIYGDRPSGCHTYPLVYSREKGVIIDKLCPMGNTISRNEFLRKKKLLINLIRIMEEENGIKILRKKRPKI